MNETDLDESIFNVRHHGMKDTLVFCTIIISTYFSNHTFHYNAETTRKMSSQSPKPRKAQPRGISLGSMTSIPIARRRSKVVEEVERESGILWMMVQCKLND